MPFGGESFPDKLNIGLSRHDGGVTNAFRRGVLSGHHEQGESGQTYCTSPMPFGGESFPDHDSLKTKYRSLPVTNAFRRGVLSGQAAGYTVTHAVSSVTNAFRRGVLSGPQNIASTPH